MSVGSLVRRIVFSSAVVSIALLAAQPAVAQTCEPPFNLAPTDGFYPDRVEMTWRIPLDLSPDEYRVWVYPDSTTPNGELLGTVTILSFTDTTPRPAPVWYSVQAVGGGCDVESGRNRGSTCVGPPVNPSNLTASQGTSSDVQLAWLGFSTGTLGYEVWRATSLGGTRTLIQFVTAPANPFFVDETAEPGQEYYYWIRATNGCGPSEYTAPATGFVCSQPNITGFQASRGITGRIDVTWDSTGQPGAQYELWRKQQPGMPWELLSANLTTTSYSDTDGIVDCQPRQYRLRSPNGTCDTSQFTPIFEGYAGTQCSWVEWTQTGTPSEVCGDGDGVLEPGEAWNIPVTLQNLSTSGTFDVTAGFAVEGSPDGAILATPMVDFGFIPAGGQTTQNVELYLQPGFLGCGQPVEVVSTGIFWSGGFVGANRGTSNRWSGVVGPGCDSGTVCAAPGLPAEAYWPLALGEYWDYRNILTATGVQFSHRSAVRDQNVDVEGVPTFALWDEEILSGDQLSVRNLTVDGNGVREHQESVADEFNPALGAAITSFATFVPPLQWSLAEVAPGQTFTSRGIIFRHSVRRPRFTPTTISAGTTSEYVATIQTQGVEQVVVPAGQYNDAFRVDVDVAVSSTTGSIISGSEWWVPEIGIVKRAGTIGDALGSAAIDATSELTDTTRSRIICEVPGGLVTASPTSPQDAGTTVTISATAQTTPGTVEYQFWQIGPGTAGEWVIVQPYSTDNTYEWNTATGDIGATTFRVWMRCVGNFNQRDVWAELVYTVTGDVCAVTGGTLTPDVASPQEAGTAVTLTANAQGADGPVEYQFWQIGPGTGGDWVIAQAYSTDNTYTWNTTAADIGDTLFRVWMRCVGNQNDRDVWAQLAYTINASSGGGGNCAVTGGTITPDVTSPQEANTSVTFTTVALGATHPVEYQFWQLGPGTGGNWIIAQAYSPSNTYTWNTTPSDQGDTTFRVWMRCIGNTEPRDAWVQTVFSIMPGVGADCAVTGGVVNANLASPQNAGTTVTLTGVAQGATGPVEYQFWQIGPGTGGDWVIAQAYSTNDSYTWNTTAADLGETTFRVWMRCVGNATARDAWAQLVYTVTPGGGGGGCAVTSGTVNANAASPQQAGTTVSITGVPQGATGPVEYQFWQLGPGTGGDWVIAQAYSTNDTYSWNTTTADEGDTTFRVWMRCVGNANARDAWGQTVYTVTPALGTGCAVTGGTVGTSIPDGQTAGGIVTISATAQGQNAAVEYQFWQIGPGTGGDWTIVQAYSGSNEYVWNTTNADIGDTTFRVWMRCVGNPTARDAWVQVTDFTITPIP